MDIIQAVKQATLRCVRDKYADFSGRAGRAEFWYFMLGWLVASTVLGLLHLHFLNLLLNLGLLVPGLAAGTRRLHDVDKSGWFQLLGLIPVIGFILVVYWMTLPGTGPNQFGEAPADIGDAPAAMPPGAV
jgi:uncharacterized membrane protein YhaH (DUF805 family)